MQDTHTYKENLKGKGLFKILPAIDWAKKYTGNELPEEDPQATCRAQRDVQMPSLVISVHAVIYSASFLSLQKLHKNDLSFSA